MKGQWLRAGSWLMCGAQDDCRIEAGQPYLLICGEGWTKARCQRHAGRPVPEDWEQQTPPARTRSRHREAPLTDDEVGELAKATPLTSTGALATDWKAKQARTDED